MLEEKRSGKRWDSWHYVSCPPPMFTGHSRKMSFSRTLQQQSGVNHLFISSFPDGSGVQWEAGHLSLLRKLVLTPPLKSNMRVQGNALPSPQRFQGAYGGAEIPSDSCARRQCKCSTFVGVESTRLNGKVSIQTHLVSSYASIGRTLTKIKTSRIQNIYNIRSLVIPGTKKVTTRMRKDNQQISKQR